MYHHTTGVLGNNGSRIKSFTFACRQTHLMVNYAIIKITGICLWTGLILKGKINIESQIALRLSLEMVGGDC